MLRPHKLFFLCLLFHYGALHCYANGTDEPESLEVDDLVVEEDSDSEAEDVADVPVFEPTWEWKEILEGQSIPAGLHVRMNLETGHKKAKLLSSPEDDDSAQSEEDDEPRVAFQTESENNSLQAFSEEQGNGDANSVGDTRRLDHYGESDRRGVVNKRTKLFSRQELSEMLKNLQDDSADTDSPPPQIATDHSGKMGSNAKEPQFDAALDSEDQVPLSVSLHRDVEAMLQHTQTLAAAANTSIADILHALEELEYYVHQIDNARDLNTIGGLVLVVRMLNHTAPEVRSHAAHVVGSAAQSNPKVQAELVHYGCLPLLCSLVQAGEPDLVQRRALFALSALLRGNREQQLLFVNKHHGLSVLGTTFSKRSAPVQLKTVTLLTDIINEYTDPHDTEVSQEDLVVLFNQVMKYGWCQSVASLIHSDQLTHVEKGLLAMEVLSAQSICSFASQLSHLRTLMDQLRMKQTEGTDLDEDFIKSLVDLCGRLITSIRQLNMEL